MKDLKIGVIGASGRGRLADYAHQPGSGSQLVGAADTSPKALTGFKEKYGENVFLTSDYKELLANSEIDAVFVSTPDFLHEEQSLAALEAGKAVYLEKPMAITVEGCDRILEMAYKTKSKLYLGHNMRHFPVILKMKELIDNDVIGRVQAIWCRHFISYGGDAYFKDWHSERELTTGMLLQKGAHDIDIIHWLAGSYTDRVIGMGKLSVYNECHRRSPETEGDSTWSLDNWPPHTQKNLSPKIDIEDHSMIMMNLENGVQANYMQCHYTPDAERNYTIIGTKGRIENMGDHGDCQVHAWTQRTGRSADIIYDLKKKEGGHGGSDPNIVKEFVNFVRDGIKTNTSPIAARNSVATGVMGTQSLRDDNIPQVIPKLSKELIDYFENGQVS